MRANDFFLGKVLDHARDEYLFMWVTRLQGKAVNNSSDRNLQILGVCARSLHVEQTYILSTATGKCFSLG